MSVYGLVYYRREGYLPGASRAPFNAEAIDPDKEAFSTAPHDDDEYVPVHNAEDHELPDYEAGSAYAGGSGLSMSSRHDTAYGGYTPPSVHDESTGYTGYAPAARPTSSVGGRVQFPDARYDNV